MQKNDTAIQNRDESRRLIDLGKLGNKQGQQQSSSEGVEGEKIIRSDLIKMIKDQRYRCALSGRTLTPDVATLDHIHPLSRGGSMGLENVHILHADVNRAKAVFTVDEFFRICRDVFNHIESLSSERAESKIETVGTTQL